MTPFPNAALLDGVRFTLRGSNELANVATYLFYAHAFHLEAPCHRPWIG